MRSGLLSLENKSMLLAESGSMQLEVKSSSRRLSYSIFFDSCKSAFIYGRRASRLSCLVTFSSYFASLFEPLLFRRALRFGLPDFSVVSFSVLISASLSILRGSFSGELDADGSGSDYLCWGIEIVVGDSGVLPKLNLWLLMTCFWSSGLLSLSVASSSSELYLRKGENGLCSLAFLFLDYSSAAR